MATEDTASAENPNVVWTIIRYVLIGVGAMSLVGLSIPALGLQYSDVFLKTLQTIKDVVGYTQLFVFLEEKIKLAAAHVGFPKFHLEEWWRDTFSLLWLFCGSTVRNTSPDFVWSRVFLFIWGGITALVAAVATGAVPLDSWAMALWPGAWLAAFYAANLAWIAWDRPVGTWLYYGGWSALRLAAFAAAVTLLGYFITTPMVLVVPSPGLVLVACVVFGFGLNFLLKGLFESFKPDFNHGRDIVGVFGIAFVVAIIGLL